MGENAAANFFARIESHEPERVGWAHFCAHAVSRIAHCVGKR